MENFKLDDKVKVIGKNISGKIAFVGETHFSEGEWFGLILDEPKGRNNGSIGGQHYFRCPRNYGLFVRSCQLRKEGVQSEADNGCEPKKTLYPNYLINSTCMKNKSEKKIKSNKPNEKSPARQIHPMNTVIEDLKNILKSKCEEMFKLENEKRETVQKLKVAETERQKLYKELKNCSKRENDLKLIIKTTKTDLLLLKRKLCKTETSLQSSENKRSKLDMAVENLREITEHAIIEKEIAEEKNEQSELFLKDETDKYKALEIELDIMKEKMELQSINGVPAVHIMKHLEKENTILKYALFRLRDLYEKLNQQFLNSKKVVEKHSKKIADLKSAEKAMEGTLCKYQEEASELYDIIDSMANADDVVFEMTERNLKAEDKINHLYQTLYDTESELEVSEELEETLQEIRLMCRDEIECLETKIRHMQTALDQKAIFMEEREETINKYRVLTSTLQERNRKLAEDLEAVNKERKEAVLAAENLKLKIQREARNATKNLIEKENMKFDLENYRDELNYWMPFMPDHFFEQDGENTAVQVKLIASKMLNKLSLLISFLQSSSYDSKPDELKRLALNTIFLASAYELYGLIYLFIKSSDRIDPEYFLTLGKYHETLEKESKEIDSYLSLLAKGDFEMKNCVDNIKNMCCSLSHLLNTKYATDVERVMIYLICYLNMIQSNCKCFLAYCSALETNTSSKLKADIKIVAEKVNRVKSNVNSLLNIARNYENERLCFIPVVEERVKNNWKTIKEITNYIINKHETLFEDDYEMIISDSKDKEIISLNEVICKCIAVDIDFHELYEKLSYEEYLVEYSPDSIFSPVYNWAQRKKEEKEQLISNLKCQISTYNMEIINLTERFRKEKNKINKIQVLAKKDASHQTEEQKYYIGDSSAMTNFSLSQQSKIQAYYTGDSSDEANYSLSQGSDQTYCSDFCSLKTNYLLSTLHDMENTMKYLKQKNFELMISTVKNHHEILRPLRVLPKPKYHHDTHNILLLQKKLNKLAVKLRGTLLPHIVDITGKTKSAKDIKYKRYLTEKVLINREIENEMWNITIEIKKLKSSSRSIWSS